MARRKAGRDDTAASERASALCCVTEWATRRRRRRELQMGLRCWSGMNLGSRTWTAGARCCSLLHMPEWRTVPAELKYWHLLNHGFNASNAKLMCSDCAVSTLLPPCPDCGHESGQLGTAMAFPGVFCEQCQQGFLAWKCRDCGASHKTRLLFYYDALSVKIGKKGLSG